MAKLTNVSCEYTGGGVWVFTAILNDEVYFMTDFLSYDSYGCYDAPLDVVEADILPDGHINYDGHWKNPSAPLPQWVDIIIAVRNNCGETTADEIRKHIPTNIYNRVGENYPAGIDPHSERLTILSMIIEEFEEFLEERGIDVPNDEKTDDPDASTIYGSDYGDLSDRIETLLIKLGYMEKEEE